MIRRAVRRYRPSGRRDVAEAVLIAALSALATALVELGKDAAEHVIEKRRESKKGKPTDEKADASSKDA